MGVMSQTKSNFRSQSESSPKQSSLEQNSAEIVVKELGRLLYDHRGIEVIAMDMRPLNFWTDFFLIATVTSSTHLSGLERHIKEYTRDNDLEIFHRTRRLKPGAQSNSIESDSDEWSLVDLGNIVIHLMSAKTRQFFELERLWSAAPLIFQAENSKPSPGSQV